MTPTEARSEPARQQPISQSILRPIHFLVFTGLLVLFSPALYAATSRNLIYIKTSWARSEGLPSDQVRALLQSRDGYIWIGTEAGLARFDGLNLVVFTRKSHPEMVNDDCRVLAEDSEGAIWIGTLGGVLRYHKGIFMRFTTKQGLYPGYVHALCPSRFGGIWIGMANGLNRFHQGILTRVVPQNGEECNNAAALLEDDSGILWIGGAPGLHWFDPASGRLSRERAAGPPGYSLSGVEMISRDPAGNVWLIAASQLYRLDDRKWKLISPGHSAERNRRFIVHDWHGGTWTGGDTGLNRWHQGQFLHNETLPWLRRQTFFCMLSDREGNLWLGGSPGLMRWSPRAAQAYSVDWGLAHRNATTVFEDHTGTLWIGSEGGLSCFLSEPTLQYPNVTWPLKEHAPDLPLQPAITNYTQADGLVHNAVRSLAEDDTGALWVGTIRGVSLWKNRRFSDFALPGELSGSKIHVIAKTADGAMWLGSELGLHCWRNQRLSTLTQSSGLSHNHIRALHSARDGSLWVGTLGGGVNRLTWKRDAAYDLTYPNVAVFTTSNGLSSDTAWAFHEERDGTLWIGTDHGLNRFKDGQIVSFKTREGLPDGIVNHILEDDAGNLWIGCDRGVYRVRKQELDEVAERRKMTVTSILYAAGDGMPGSTSGQNSQPAARRTRDGRLWFATPVGGVAVIDPQRLFYNEVPPPVVIERVVADHRPLFDNVQPIRRSDARIETQPPHSDAPTRSRSSSSFSLNLPAGSGRSLEFYFTANSLAAPHKNRFKYRMEGVDSDWVDGGTRRVAYYNALPPGDYRFRVRACNNDGVWNTTDTSFAFHIEPYFYQTWTFRGLCGLGAIAAVGLIIWRERKISRLRQQLALQEERARIARDIHDDLGAQIGRLIGRSRVAESERSGSDSISKLADEAAQSLDAVIWAIDSDTKTLEDFAGFLSGYAYEYLRPTSLRLRLDIPTELPRWSLSADLRHHLPCLVKEALHYVVRHARASEVLVQLEVLSHSNFPTALGRRTGPITNPKASACLRLKITDDGQGFQTQCSPNSPFHSGLSNMRQRIEELLGQCEIESAPGQGTSIIATIPIEARTAGKRCAGPPGSSIRSHVGLSRFLRLARLFRTKEERGTEYSK